MSFLKNAWYVAAWSKDLAREPVARRYLNEPVVLYRKENGEPVALVDRCPHRFAPLSSGKLIGDVVQCGYHGLRFNSEGQCVHNPHGDHKIPNACKVRAYPVVDKHSLLWIWMGDAERADPALIPNVSFLADPNRSTLIGGMIMKAHYELLMDNLMDLSHGQFVHASFMKDAEFVKGTNTVVQDGNAVSSNQWVPSGKVHGMYGSNDDPDALYDQWWDIRWDPPGVLVLNSGITRAGAAREEGRINLSGHLVTPETESTTHYFYSNSRDWDVDNKELDERIRHWQHVGFHEQDHPMIESVHKNMENKDLLAMKPILLAPDAGAIRMRRILKKLIDDEQAAGSEKAEAPRRIVPIATQG